jgi:hypothetical protein
MYRPTVTSPCHVTMSPIPSHLPFEFNRLPGAAANSNDRFLGG